MNKIIKELDKKLEKNNILVYTSPDGKTQRWVSKTEKINYDELYKIVIQLHKN